MTRNPNARPGSHAVISQSVFHDFLPLAFVPVNLAPSAGPDAPPFQMAPVASGDHSPMRVTSLMSDHTTSGGGADVGLHAHGRPRRRSVATRRVGRRLAGGRAGEG